MKSIFKFTGALFLLCSLTVISCKKEFLEITPKGKLIAKTTNDYDKLLSNLSYLNVSSAFSIGMSQVAMGDEVAAVEPYFSGSDLHTQRLFRWDDVIYEPNEDALEMSVPMENIYSFNKIINGVMDATGGTEQQKKSVRAEALAGRAWTYFLLINYYGKPYDPASAATDPGYPIVKEADVTADQFTRASVQEVYEFIVEDLTTAIPDLPVQTTHRLRMSKAAGEGLLGKVYMFMGMYAEALPYLNASIADLANSAIPLYLYDYNTAFAPGGAFTPIGLFGPTVPTAPNNAENVYARQFINAWTFTNNELVITTQTAALYAPSDLRLNFYSTNAFFGSAYPNGMLRRIGPIAKQFGVVVPDLYLLNAECKARLNDLPGAVAVLETFREHRMPVADAPVSALIAADREALVKFILEERIREFAMQGDRWFDMRRLSVDPLYSATIETTHNVYSASGEVLESFTLRPERYVMRFPQKIMDQNPGMENNP